MDNNIASVQEAIGETFDPSDSATYTWNSTALDLPDGYIANTLTEVGTYLVIGTYFSAAKNRGNRAVSFPWDRISDSFNNPVKTDGNGVQMARANANVLYSVVDRTKPRIYATNLSSVDLLRELSFLTSELALHPDAIEAVVEELFLGLGSNSSGSTRCGVYSMKNGLVSLAHTLSPGDSEVEVTSITSNGDSELLVTWENNGTNPNTYGADFIANGTFVENYSASLEDRLTRVGTANQKKQFKDIYIDLGRDLLAGHGVKVEYRESLSDTFVELGVYDFATYGEVSSIHKAISIPQLSSVQLRVSLTTPGTSTPELLSVTLT